MQRSCSARVVQLCWRPGGVRVEGVFETLVLVTRSPVPVRSGSPVHGEAHQKKQISTKKKKHKHQEKNINSTRRAAGGKEGGGREGREGGEERRGRKEERQGALVKLI